MDPRSIPDQVSALIAPILEREGTELVDVEYRREQGAWVLRVFIDKPGGIIALDDCAQVSHKIGDVIEIEDVISHRYRLEVSSPGLDRVLKKESDFQRFSGRRCGSRRGRPSREEGISRGRSWHVNRAWLLWTTCKGT